MAHTNVGALNGGLGRPEAQADVLVPSPASLSNLLALAALALRVEEDVWLLLESAFALDCRQMSVTSSDDLVVYTVVDACAIASQPSSKRTHLSIR